MIDESPERIFLLRYEDVILRPNEVVPPLLEFLRIDASEHSLQMMMEPISPLVCRPSRPKPTNSLPRLRPRFDVQPPWRWNKK